MKKIFVFSGLLMCFLHMSVQAAWTSLPVPTSRFAKTTQAETEALQQRWRAAGYTALFASD